MNPQLDEVHRRFAINNTARMRKSASDLSVPTISESILFVRGERVLIDATLAKLYGVETGTLVQAIKRNLDRFPKDFMFQLTDDEWNSLRSQIVISKPGRGGRRYSPYAFTEQGVAMLSSVLKSKRAIQVNIEIMRAFVRMRELLASNKELAKQLDDLERKVSTHDQAIVGILVWTGDMCDTCAGT